MSKVYAKVLVRTVQVEILVPLLHHSVSLFPLTNCSNFPLYCQAWHGLKPSKRSQSQGFHSGGGVEWGDNRRGGGGGGKGVRRGGKNTPLTLSGACYSLRNFFVLEI